MRLEIKDSGYDLVEIYRTEKGQETHIWHFDKNGEFKEKRVITIMSNNSVGKPNVAKM